jgi:hypothetical protein
LQFSKKQELGVSLILEPPIINKIKYPPNTGNNHKKETTREDDCEGWRRRGKKNPVMTTSDLAIIKLCCVSCHWNRLSLFCDYSTHKSIIMGLCFYYEAILYFSNLSIILLAFETMKICLLYSPLELATTQLCFPYAIWIQQRAKNPTSYVWNQSSFIVILESSYHCGYFSTIPQIYGAHPLLWDIIAKLSYCRLFNQRLSNKSSQQIAVPPMCQTASNNHG